MHQPHPHPRGSRGRPASEPWLDLEEDALEHEAHPDDRPDEERRPGRVPPSLDPPSVDGGFGWVPFAMFVAAATYRVAHGLQHHEGPTLTMLGLATAIGCCFWFAAGELVVRRTDRVRT